MTRVPTKGQVTRVVGRNKDGTPRVRRIEDVQYVIQGNLEQGEFVVAIVTYNDARIGVGVAKRAREDDPNDRVARLLAVQRAARTNIVRCA